MYLDYPCSLFQEVNLAKVKTRLSITYRMRIDMFNRKLIGSVLFILLLQYAQAQKKWTLQDCIAFGIENSLQLKQSQISVRNSEITQQLAKESRYPNLDFNTNVGSNFGRTIDPTTNSFVVSTLSTNRTSLNTGVVLFAGNRINNTITQAGFDILASRKDQQQVSNDIALNISQAYLFLLLSYDNLDAAKANLELTQAQYDQTSKLVKAGSLAMADLYEVESQLARNEQEVVTAQNNIVIGLLQLQQLMFLDPSEPFEIDRPVIEIDEFGSIISAQEVFESALRTQPQVEAAEYRIKSAQKGEQIAKAEYYPTIGAFGQLNTNYSSLARDIQGFNIVQSAPTPVVIDGETRIIQFFQEVPNFVNQNYFEQLDRNLGIGVGISLTLPIYSNGRVRLGAERAKLNTYNNEIQSESVKMQLKNDVERAVADVRASRQNYLAARKASVAATRVLSDAQKRYDVGAINSFEYTSAKTRYDAAIIAELIAKYEYLFNTKIVDFYLGKPISLEGQ